MQNDKDKKRAVLIELLLGCSSADEKIRSLEGLVPSVDVTIVEGGPLVIVLGTYTKEIPASDLDVFIEKVKAKNPGKRVVISRMPHQEFERICQKLEEEY